MHRRSLSLTLALACLLLAGCGGEKEAREYAAQLAAILKNYQAQVDKHLQAQVDAYNDLARVLDVAATDDAKGISETDRRERSLAFADQLLSMGNSQFEGLTRTQFRETLDAFAKVEVARNRAMVTRDLDSYRRFLEGTQDLEQATADIAQLEKQFADLSKKSGAVDQIKRLAAFGQDVKSRYDRLLCDGSKSEQQELQDQIAALDKQLSDPATKDPEKLKLTAQKTNSQAALKQVNDRIQACPPGASQ
jgi:uncharacterized phage infection (PIP) family protein YhgE